MPEPPPVLLLMAAFSRHAAALDWAWKRAGERWGPVALRSEPFEFAETAYYEPTMGPGLVKQFAVFERLVGPARLPELKLEAIAWERELAESAQFTEPRPLNLDPGYLTLGKLVLASTKDYAHRIYLREGIHAEITLYWRRGQWEGHEWTFPDYRRADYHQFFTACRDYLHARLRAHPSPLGGEGQG
jgi:hypothetical protein